MSELQRIDTHLHLALRDHLQYPWMKEIPLLDQGSFGLSDYQRDAADCGISGTVFMETDAAEGTGADEIRLIYDLSEQADSGILGAIATARPEHPDFSRYLDSIAHPRLSGIRRILHTQPDEVSQLARFREHMGVLAKRNLPFDLCVLQKQLPIALELVNACPETCFILDHCGVPDISTNQAPHGEGWTFWKEHILKIASHPNVMCKISGIILYASDSQRTPDGLRPYVETVIDSFGWDRVVWGGDWPVCTLASSLHNWCTILNEVLQGEPEHHLQKLFSENACRIYQL